MENVERNSPNPLKFIRGRCNNLEEAIDYQSKLGEEHGVSIKICEDDPKIIEITELDPGAVGPDLFGNMNKILIDRYQRELAQEEREQKTKIIQPSVTSQIPVSAVTAPPETESYISRLLNHVVAIFKSPAKPLRQSDQSV